ncbi:ubiquinol oxidase subunit II, cyanide insensitive [Siccirubricoccus deserti]|uniref:Cytochrome d ubiquinol oxidase subunit II n=1 Tax=Siccirubricoccus deserti TaxID=2013562 RepID=A0A9X0UD12_9PROT|nr:cytochrome d ubiquinol oxidase subunit II [Siccirubricoccus deserti]MBC4015043.1 cytochrome d ubiquinol oxidase subunit II [Siccirubricoccus deserti]GGC36075.1 ubiquinol oxidase subunit II, cyanide insensitive [Siccirubricoccus deserti]
MSAETIATIWAFIIATAVFLYVCMDGFDLGVGILFPWIRGQKDRDLAVNTVAPVWDGNETWLVMGGGGLFGVFPLAYATIMPALYMPIIIMLLALIFRGVAFEMRFRAATDAQRIWWDRSFSGGSYAAAFAQGVALGALVQGVEVQGRAYAGGWWDWLSPFSVLTGCALLAGYGMLGACWLVWKTEGEMQDQVRGLARGLTWLTLGFIIVVSLVVPFLLPQFRDRWFNFPIILTALPVPVLVVVLTWRLFRGLEEAGTGKEHRRVVWRDGVPFACALGLFFLSYTGLGISMWPMIVPPGITIWEAASPRDSQLFMLVGAAVLIPVILAYTAYVYWLFRGKVKAGEGYH